MLLKDCLVGGSWFVVFSLTFFLNGKNAYLVIAIFLSALYCFVLILYRKIFIFLSLTNIDG